MSMTIATAKRLEKVARTREDLQLPALISEFDGEIVPNSEGRDAVMHMAMAGASVSEIAKVFGVSPAWIKKNCQYELETATTINNSLVTRALLNNALEGDTAAQKFWLKAKANWRETRDEVDNPTIRIQPVLNVSILTPQNRDLLNITPKIGDKKNG